MIVLIMSDKMPFGAPPLLRVYCWLYRDFRPFNRLLPDCQSKRGDDCRVYGGHGGATKTRLISNVKSAMISLVNKGSYAAMGCC